jgi:hypothetical protein
MDRAWMPTVGGILSIIAGALSLIGALLVGIFLSIAIISPDWYGSTDMTFPSVWVWIVILPYLIICIVAIVGGIYAIRKRAWGLALAGGICAILTIWAWWIGVAAVVFIALSRSMFDRSSTLPGPPLP